MFMGAGQGMMEALPGPPGMMMGDPMQGLPGAPFPGELHCTPLKVLWATQS